MIFWVFLICLQIFPGDCKFDFKCAEHSANKGRKLWRSFRDTNFSSGEFLRNSEQKKALHLIAVTLIRSMMDIA